MVEDFEEERFKHYVEDENINPEKARRMARGDVIAKEEGRLLSERELRSIEDKERRAQLLQEQFERSQKLKEPEFLKTSSEKMYEDEEQIEPEKEISNYRKEKAILEEDEYIKDLESKERSKDIISGIFGFGSRTPVKEAIVSGVVSGATKLAKALKGKPKTEADIKREERIKEAQTERRIKEITSPSYGRKHTLTEEMGFRESSRRSEETEPSLRDIGKGSMGAERYSESKPDFFGGSSYGTSRNPLGEPTRTKRSKAPETRIPFGGAKPPSTGIPYIGSRPPSTSIYKERGRIVSTKIPKEKRISTHIPLVRGKAPETRYQGAKYVSTKIPRGQRKAPVVLAKKGKPISTRIGRSSKIKTRVPQIQEDVVDVLGLRGFF